MGLSHSPRIVTDGLVLCLDAANSRSYPGTGTTWTDLKGENNGTLTNGLTFDGDNNGGIGFDGSNNYVEIANSSGSEYNFSNMSFGCWFKSSSTQAITPLASKISNIFGGVNGWLMQIGSSDGLYFRPSYAGSSAITSQNVRDGNWHYAIGTADGTNAKIYVDGVLKNTASNGNTSNSTFSVYIGAWGFLGSLAYYAEANIASVHIYNKALDDSEVLQNYLATRGRYK